ncbi:hypothetical protein [Martelella radicis]|uniref:Uncharacterized protein n=1 Tax=Martelella radicis TaxID=1397476 RepID=A0A7W6KQ94_9HYPH|nr:hypothetical protein [Martelella radicis]MBB4123983.1 hypothetical protein [Martelella radicis]
MADRDNPAPASQTSDPPDGDGSEFDQYNNASSENNDSNIQSSISEKRFNIIELTSVAGIFFTALLFIISALQAYTSNKTMIIMQAQFNETQNEIKANFILEDKVQSNKISNAIKDNLSDLEVLANCDDWEYINKESQINILNISDIYLSDVQYLHQLAIIYDLKDEWSVICSRRKRFLDGHCLLRDRVMERIQSLNGPLRGDYEKCVLQPSLQ